MISYAPDDGQALSLIREQEQIKVSMKVAKNLAPQKRRDWEWISFEIPLIKEIRGKEFQSPDLRCGIVHSQLVPILDMKVKGKKKLRHCLNGWKNSVSIRPLIEDRKNTVFLKPVIFGAGTLRL